MATCPGRSLAVVRPHLGASQIACLSPAGHSTGHITASAGLIACSRCHITKPLSLNLSSLLLFTS